MRGRLLTSTLLVFLLGVGGAPLVAPSTAAAAPATASAEVPLEALLSAVKARYADTTAISAHFTQVTRSPAFGEGPAQQGTLLIARPRHMRVEFQGADASQFVSDGQTLWVYSPASQQVIVTPDLSGQSDGLSDLLGSLAALEERFEVTRLPADAEGGHRLSLRPRGAEAAQLKALNLTLQADTLLLARLEIVDAFDGVTEMRFSEVALNPAVPEGAFAFTPPPGVQVIRTDQI